MMDISILFDKQRTIHCKPYYVDVVVHIPEKDM